MLELKLSTLCDNLIKIIFFPWFLYIGVPGLITVDMVKKGAAVIDVGINRIQDPKTGKIRLIGDVDFEGKKIQNSVRILCVRGALYNILFQNRFTVIGCNSIFTLPFDLV